MRRNLLSTTETGGPAIVSIADLIRPVAEIVFVDSNIADLATLLAGLKPGVEVVMLDSSGDALGQIAGALAGRDGIGAIHIIANGGEGGIAFGAGGVGLADLAHHAADLAAIAAALADDGDILLWSCDTGAGTAGQAFIDALALATGADVAASTGKTGASGLGGDWVLEARSGAIEAGVPLTAAGIESYEGLLDAPTVAFAPYTPAASGEVQVNSYTTGFQVTPAIATLANGGHVVVWGSDGQDGSGLGVYLQRFDAFGAPDGAEFRVNTTTAGTQAGHSVAVLANGNTVVTWYSSDGSGYGIYSQSFDPSGAPLGSELLVNFTSADDQIGSQVVALAGGGYVVVWQSQGQDGFGWGIYAQRFEASGAPVGPETHVSTATTGDQYIPAVAAIADGGYVVAWESPDGSSSGIYLQRYDASGVPVGVETLVNTTTGGAQEDVDVTGLADGGYLVVWVGAGIIAQRYDASGAAVGGEMQISTLPGSQFTPSVAGLLDGGYLVTWSSGGEVWARRYDSADVPDGAEQQVNTYTTTGQGSPAIAVNADGGYVIAWQSNGQDGDDGGIYSQRFDANLIASEDAPLDLSLIITLDDADDSGGSYTVTLTVDSGTIAADPGITGVTVDDSDPQSIIFTGTLAQIQLLLDGNGGAVIYTPDDFAPPASATLTVTVDDGTDQTSGAQTITIIAVNDAPYLDLDFTDISASGLDSAAEWTSGDDPVVLAFAVELDDDDPNNSYPGATLTVGFTANGTADDQLSILSVGDGLGEIRVDGTDIYYEGTLVGTFSGGDDGSDLVVTFNADACHCAVQMVVQSITFANDAASPDITDRTVTFTLVDGGGTALGGADTASADVTVTVHAGGNAAPTVAIDAPIVPAGGEFQVNTSTEGRQQDAAVAALVGGGFVVTWTGYDANEDNQNVYAQRYDAAGNALGGEVVVGAFTTYDQVQPAIAALPDGGYIITWISAHETGGNEVYVRRFDASGVALSDEVRVNTIADLIDEAPAVTVLAGGGFVVTWSSSDENIYARRYDAAGNAQGAEVVLAAFTAGYQYLPAIAALQDGGYAVTWISSHETGGPEIFVRRFDALGVAQGDEVRVSLVADAGDEGPVVAALSGGGFVVTWTAMGRDGSAEGVYAQRYDAAGNAQGGEFRVNTTTFSNQYQAAVAALPGGGFMVTWTSSDQDGSYGGVYAQRYDAAGVAEGGEFLVNSTTSNDQRLPAIAALPGGGLVVAWQSAGQDGSDYGIYAQRFDESLTATEQVALDLKGKIAIGDTDSGSDIITVTLSVTEGVLNVDPGTSGVTVDDSDQQNIILTGTLAEIQALLSSDPTSSVTYTYDDDFLPAATIELSVTIDDGTDDATDTVVIDLTPVNDAAQLDLDLFTAGNDAVATYIAGDPATPIAFYATFDDDNVDWDGATLTIAITGATADDQLIIDETLATDTTIVGNDIFYDGDLIGTWSGGDDGNPLVITFNADACACAVEEVVYAIAYSSSDATPAISTRDVTFTFVDGDGTANSGTDTATATVELTVTPGPTPPVVDAGAVASGNEDTAIALTGVTITDDGDPTTGLITVHLGVEHGTLTIRTDVAGGIDASNIVGSASGRGITIIGTPAEINATLAATNGLRYQGDANFNGADALTVRANDGTPDSPLAISSLGAQPFFDFPSAAAFHDVDGDGLDDLILGIGDGTDPSGVLILANGIGGFGLPGGAADAFAFGDFDGDGEVDVGVASWMINGFGYVGYYSSDLEDFVTIETIGAAIDLVAGDFDGNGLMDLAAANSDEGNIAILLQTAPGVFAPAAFKATIGLTVSIATGDFNGDGVLDLLASNYGELSTLAAPGSVQLFLGDGAGDFAAATAVLTGASNADGIVVADFNGDGFDDFAFASSNDADAPDGVRGVQVVLGDGNGGFGAATSYVTTANGSPHDIRAGDLNGDGIVDLVVTNMDASGTFSILVGNGDGSFQTPVDFDAGVLPYVVALGDADGDGDLDLIVGAVADGTYEAFNNDGYHRGGTAVKAITVNSVNDTPSGADATVTFDEDSSYVFTEADFGFSDVDGGILTTVKMTILPTAGTLFYDADGPGGNAAVVVPQGQFISAADIAAGRLFFTPAANGNGTGYASLSFKVQDDGGTANGGKDRDLTSNTITFNVTGTPDAPAGGVTISGAALVNQVLTADTSALSDPDGLGTFHYQWQRDDGGVITDVGSDQATYTLGAGDVGVKIRVRITFTDGGGTPESVLSTETGVVGTARTTQTITDTADNKPWALQMTEFDAGDSISSQTVVLDNGRTWVNTYDTLNTSSVKWSTTNYAPGGAILQQTVTYDDGTHSLTINDVGNLYAWTQAVITFTADWQIASLTGTRDAGGSVTSFAEIADAYESIAWYATPFDINFDPFGTYGTLPTNMSLLGGANGDVLYGFDGADTLSGMAGGDLIVGGRGNDLLSGGSGDDIFRFRSGDGFDTITDFTAGNSSGDLIDLHDYGITDFTTLLAKMSQVGADTVITLDDENRITLQQVTLGDLNAADFLFS